MTAPQYERASSELTPSTADNAASPLVTPSTPIARLTRGMGARDVVSATSAVMLQDTTVSTAPQPAPGSSDANTTVARRSSSTSPYASVMRSATSSQRALPRNGEAPGSRPARSLWGISDMARAA